MTEWTPSIRPGRSVDHVALCPSNIEQSLKFYRDGLGLAVLNDITTSGDLDKLFGVQGSTIRAVFLGDAEYPFAGKLELVEFPGESLSPATDRSRRYGFFLLSFAVDVQAVSARLVHLGFETPTVLPRRGGQVAVVHDPDGVLVELIERVPTPEPERFITSPK